MRDYTRAALAGDMNRATEIAASLQPLRQVHAKWIMGYWNRGRMPMAAMKYWQELIGMHGGPIRPPLIPLSKADRAELRADLAATGILDRVAEGTRAAAE